MGLTRPLGEKYLWVDRFFICQDDDASKQPQLQLMADIYGHTYLTINAANGCKANHELHRFKGVTERREFSPHLDCDLHRNYMNLGDSIWARLRLLHCLSGQC